MKRKGPAIFGLREEEESQVGQAAIDVFAIADVDNEDCYYIVTDGIDNTVVP